MDNRMMWCINTRTIPRCFGETKMASNNENGIGHLRALVPFSSIQFLLPLRFYHQSCFHGHYVLIVNPASTYHVMRQHLIARILCLNPASISIKEVSSFINKTYFYSEFFT